MTADRLEFDAYQTEYQQCMDSYRHTYQTIWQAAGFFVTASAAIVAFGGRGGETLAPGLQIAAPIPFLFWYLGVFRPMNRYGELRSARLAELERELSRLSGANLRHFSRYDTSRKSDSTLRRLLTFKWVWRPRVSEVVSILGLGVLVLELTLIVMHLL